MRCQRAGAAYTRNPMLGETLFCLHIAQSHAQHKFPPPSLTKPLARRSFFTLPAANEGNHTNHAENKRPYRHRRPLLDLATATVLITLDKADSRLDAIIRQLANTILTGFIFATDSA